jgi:Cdc6-like AAA superfamily ATPase
MIIKFLLNERADLNTLLPELEEILGDKGDGRLQITEKINAILHRSRAQKSGEDTENEELIGLGEDSQPQLTDLSREQAAIAVDIVNDADSRLPDPSKQLMFLQGSAGTGKTHTVRAMLTELRNRGIAYFVSATTGIAAVQYPGGQTVHSLFSLGIDENQGSCFISHIGRNTQKTQKLLGARLIVIDEVSILTPWVARRISLTLRWIARGNHSV